MRFEKLVRRAAGMGAASREPDPDGYEHGHAFCDVLVVGSGPAGLGAALVAARAGLDVILAEQDFELGGNLLNQSTGEAEETRTDSVTALEAAGVRIMARTTVFGLYDHGVAGLLERVTDHIAHPSPILPRQRFWTVRAKRTILATGALERHIAFGNNDRPGIMLASAARAYLNRFGVLPGERIVVATTNDSAYDPAVELARAGATVTLLDARDTVPDALADLAKTNGVDLRAGAVPLNARGSRVAHGLETARRGGSDFTQRWI